MNTPNGRCRRLRGELEPSEPPSQRNASYWSGNAGSRLSWLGWSFFYGFDCRVYIARRRRQRALAGCAPSDNAADAAGRPAGGAFEPQNSPGPTRRGIRGVVREAQVAVGTPEPSRLSCPGRRDSAHRNQTACDARQRRL
jgi:hypothetical protein